MNRPKGAIIKMEKRVLDVLKRSGLKVIVRFTIGSRYVSLYANNCEYNLSLKYSGSPNPKEIDYRMTHQGRVMKALGFTTSDGITYSYSHENNDIRIQFYKSQIARISHFIGDVAQIDYEWHGEGNEDLRLIRGVLK